MSLVDMKINVDDFPRLSVGHRRSSSLPYTPFMIIDGQPPRSSYSYSKLPEQPIKLSVLKLNGTSFEIEVMKSATVAELRQAVEDVFSHMPRKGPGKISWPHVWGHFCLMYDGQKLLAETDCIKDFGIREDDQLQFVRHISNNYSLAKKRSMKQVATQEQHRISLSKLYSYEDEELLDEEDDRCDDIENGRHWHNYDRDYKDNYDYDYRDEDSLEHNESKWALLLKQWFPYSRLSTKEQLRSYRRSTWRSSCGIFGSFKKIVQFCGNRSPKDSRRED